MDSEEGKPHRRAADEQLREVIRQMHDDRVEARHFRMNAARDIKCLSDGFRDFKAEWNSVYKPKLDSDITADKDRRDFLRDKAKVWTSRGFDLVVGGIVAVFLYGLTAGDWVKKVYTKVVSLI